MKKLWILAVIGIMCSCANLEKTDMVNLDTAIQLASKDINDSLDFGTKVALLYFSSSSDIFSDYVLEEMSISLVKSKKLVVVDRKETDLIRGEMDFQMSGEVNDASAQKIGQKLGAQSIVSGSLISMGKSYRFRIKVINVSSAAIETSLSVSVKSDPQMQYLLAQGKKAPQTAFQSGKTATPAQSDSSGQTQPADLAELTPHTYKIGDTGPAGGLVFYDKGNNSSGWRYLEAAPVEAEFQAVWSVWGIKVESTQGNIGSGRRNTQIIVEKLKQTAGEWESAALKADSLIFNGFDDWFLPSITELDQMYGNLKRKTLGDFSNNWYLTSTETKDFWGNLSRVCILNFKDGQIDLGEKEISSNKNIKYYVRPIRQVPGPSPARSSANSSDRKSKEIYFEVGYNYIPSMPLGFSSGISSETFGFYTSWNFYIPQWNSYEGLEWLIGQTLILEGNGVSIPMGIGGKHEKERYDSSAWDSKFVMEAGVKFNLYVVYLSGTYRSYNFFKEHGFSVGAGMRY